MSPSTTKHNISLLYVEDEKILQKVYKEILIKRVEKLYTARDGDEGYKKFKQHQPDLILTDIKMPKMNGLEMIRKIKRENSNVRIVIMSAYGQPEFFMDAIDFGIKSFLLKPVKNDKLFSIINELSKEILIEKNYHIQEKKRIQAEKELKSRESILSSVSFAAEQFLKLNFGEKSIPIVLKHLGLSLKVSRVYIFENHYDKNNKLMTSQKYEWTDEETTPEINNPDLQNNSYSELGFDRWLDNLKDEKAIFGIVKDFPENEQEILSNQQIKSLIVVPIFVNTNWWGFIGFDDCKNDRIWSSSEIEALNTASNILGTAIYRNQIETILYTLNQNLEKKVNERTHKLQKEIVNKNIAEKKLIESEEKYRLIFENANDGIALTTKSIVKFINPKLVEIMGFMPKEIIGKSFLDFIHKDFKESTSKNYEERLRGEETQESLDVKIIKKSGEIIWIEAKSNVISWDNKTSLLTFITNITERKKTEEQIRTLNLHLENRVKKELSKREKQQNLLIQKSKLESLGELAAGIAHEINQPLGGISMGLENMLFKLSKSELKPDYIKNKFNIIFSDIDRIRKIIDHVRIFSRDQQKNEFDKIEVFAIINNSLSIIKNQYRNHKIQILLNNSEKKHYVYGNSFKLEQVFLNLFSNSKFALDKKKRKNPQNNYEKKININIENIKNEIIISFKDNGIGIPKNKINNIFDPFYTSKTSEAGTGLGLSISYGIINEMNGKIEAESEENDFTEITILLPEYENAIKSN